MNDLMPGVEETPRTEVRRLKPVSAEPKVAAAEPVAPPAMEVAPAAQSASEDARLAAQMALPSQAQLLVIAPQPAQPQSAALPAEKKPAVVSPKPQAARAQTASAPIASKPASVVAPSANRPVAAPARALAPVPVAVAPQPPVVAITPSAPVSAAPAAPSAPTPGGSRLARARRCLAQGNTGCVIALLEGNASTEAELELWIETLRAEGRAPESRKHMERYVAQFPDGRRATAYRRILSHSE
jgi:hypothetical protein